MHINELEAFSVALAARRWAPLWRNKRVLILCDNATTVSCLNKCSARNAILMTFLRELFWLSAKFNFHLVARHIPGKSNVLADHVSRLHELQSCEQFLRYYVQPPLFVQDLCTHMSSNALRFLLFRLTGIGNETIG